MVGARILGICGGLSPLKAEVLIGMGLLAWGSTVTGVVSAGPKSPVVGMRWGLDEVRVKTGMT